MSMIDYQRLILADRPRNEAFAAALKKVVTPGCTVVDVGAGTGFLGFLAAKLGAGRVILLECEPEFFALSREIAKRSGITNCEFIHSRSEDVKERFNADVLVSETLGNFAYEENIIEILRDAKRFLKRGGVMVPQSIAQLAAPVTGDRLWKEVTSWDSVGFDMDWSPARTVSINNMYVKTFKENELLAAQTWDHVDLTLAENKSVRSGTVEWKTDVPITLYGVCLWWTSDLCPGVTLSTAPSAPATHWQQIYLPAEQPIVLAKDETFRAHITSDSRMSVHINVQWSLEHVDASGNVRSSQKMDMRKGR
jgi:protein arginine N-methyltransferase 1